LRQIDKKNIKKGCSVTDAEVNESNYVDLARTELMRDIEPHLVGKEKKQMKINLHSQSIQQTKKEVFFTPTRKKRFEYTQTKKGVRTKICR